MDISSSEPRCGKSGNDGHKVAPNTYGQEELDLPLGLRRQPTKYPHGLSAVCVQTSCDRQERQQHATNYSRASTLRSSRCEKNRDMNCHMDEKQSQPRQYQISNVISNHGEAELQVRRYKYPHINNNYYLDTLEGATKSPLELVDYAKRFYKWKYIRWPLIFVGSVLVFFGLITYSMWLHDISVARERYLQQRKQNYEDDAKEDNDLVRATTVSVTVTWHRTTERSQLLHESTILRAISSRSNHRPREQKLTTVEYEAISKGSDEWHRERKYTIKDSPASQEQVTTTETEEAISMPANSVELEFDHKAKSLKPPLEDGVLKFMNGLLSASQAFSTVASVDNLAKVSPTIPPMTHSKPTIPMTTVSAKTMALENRCYSTSLSMCQGVLDYDLTYNMSMHLPRNDLNDYEALVISNCSSRSVEFICAVLEPECRPSHIGILSPCRRICKAILEACSEFIANSDVLTTLFDCNLYPDSNDPHQCEDPTRRKGYCYDNEFECYDRSCIPLQWQCDNIKDCSAGEDEDSCLVCDQADEFRCRSNEKCVPDSVRCDMKYDCLDGSDEVDCLDYEGEMNKEDLRFNEEDFNAFPRVFSYASILSPNQSNEKLVTYIMAATDDHSRQFIDVSNRTSGVSKEEVTNSVPFDGPKGFVNFRDSKEIMMTSDSEKSFKISSAHENRSTSKYSASTTPLQPAASNLVVVSTESSRQKSSPAACPAHQLRCVSGKCITVDQLCDKKNDCPDGFDELMCVYKDRTTTVRNRITTVLTNPFYNSSFTRNDKRTMRTTIKRKVKM